MRREKITWFVVFLLIVGSVFLVWVIGSKPKWKMLEKQEPNLALRVSSDYAREIKIVIDSYVSQRMNYAQSSKAETVKSWRELSVKTQNTLLKLKVPAKKTELHLGLVLELNNIQEALAEMDLEKAQTAEARLIKLFSQI